MVGRILARALSSTNSTAFNHQYFPDKPADAMETKTLSITSANGDQRMVSVVDTATISQIVQQCNEWVVEDRQATLLKGVTLLEPDMTVREAGLGDGEEISLVWSDPFVEMAKRAVEGLDQPAVYVRIPNNITSIDEDAFRGCKTLIKVVIPDSVTSIGNQAFAGCSSLSEVRIPNSLTSIGDGAFLCCSSLTEVKLPDSLIRIGLGAFRHCISLTDLELPNSLTSIGAGAFAFCTSLPSVKIPKSVTSLGDNVFAGCGVPARSV